VPWRDPCIALDQLGRHLGPREQLRLIPLPFRVARALGFVLEHFDFRAASHFVPIRMSSGTRSNLRGSHRALGQPCEPQSLVVVQL
jgi:hypothetical protein